MRRDPHHRARRVGSFGLTIVAACAMTSAAQAAPQGGEVVVAPIQVKGKMGEEAIGKLRLRAQEGLERAGLAASTPGAATEACDVACASDLAQQENAGHALRVEVIVEGRDFRLETALLDPAGNVVVSADQVCDICGIEEVGELISADAAALGKQLAVLGRPGHITIESTPPGATVRIDGKKRGVTPLELELPPGDHEMDVRLDGHFPREREISIVEGVVQSVDFDLQTIPQKQRNRPLWISGWTGVGVGLGMAGAGIALMAIHHRPLTGKCSGANVDSTGLCRYRYSTRTAGVTVAVVGAALVATGIVLLIKGRKPAKGDRSEQARFSATPGGFQVALPGLAQMRR
jgi:hypothetical protein